MILKVKICLWHENPHALIGIGSAPQIMRYFHSDKNVPLIMNTTVNYISFPNLIDGHVTRDNGA